jgi:suppressor of fused protein SUFU
VGREHGAAAIVKPTQRILRHGEEKEFQIAEAPGEHIQALEAHIQQHIGEVDWVFHELVSDGVHIDVHHVPPSAARPFHALVTTGMSDRAMSVPEGFEDFKFSELAIFLPPDWPMEQECFHDETVYWPIRLLKSLARLPHKYDTWLAWGHTVPNGDPAEPYVPGVKLCGALVADASPLGDDFAEARPTQRNSPVWFLGVWPLYAQEMSFKLSRGAEALLERLHSAGVDCIVRPQRRNVCARKWGLF